MTDIYENYMRLRKNAWGGYWGKRILAQTGFLISLLYEEDPKVRPQLDGAVGALLKEFEENGQIDAEVARETENTLLPLSARAKEITMICAAHAHIDMNWLWGFSETVTVTIDTVRTMLTLLEEYPDFVFSQSQASVYRILEKYAPELLEQVKRYIREGRWEVTASSWVENDKNLPTGESMARHLLYTKQYLSKLLDIRAEDLKLDFEPDTFGHSRNLPEILNRGGVTRYYHCRGYEGENIFRWRGLSGAEVLVYREPTWYIRVIDSSLCEGVPEFCRRYGIKTMLNVYGMGDHGGGPSRRDLERLKDMGTWPLFPTIKFGTYGEFYDYLEEHKEQFPVVDHELNYVFTGCYTTQSAIKAANHIGEMRLTETEVLESMAGLEASDYRIRSCEEAWRKVMFNHFHDILPGSCTGDSKEYALGEFQRAMAQAGAEASRAMTAICAAISAPEGEKCPGEGAAKDGILKDNAMGAGVGFGTNYREGYRFTLSERGNGRVRFLALFNVTQETRTDPVEIVLWNWDQNPARARVSDLEGREYPFEVLEEKAWYMGHHYCRLLVWMPVPALGYRVCRIEEKRQDKIETAGTADPRKDHITDEPICLENDKVRVVFDILTMKCISFVRKADGRELISRAKPACGFLLITEDPGSGMPAWRVGKTAKCVDLNEACSVKLIRAKTQGLRKELVYEFAVEDSRIRAQVSLDEGSEFLNYRLDVAWTMLGGAQKGIPQLRFSVPCAGESKGYRYTVPFGVLEREPLAQDVPALGLACALPKEGGSGLCIISDCKYGFRGDGEGLSLNLIRSSYEPDPYPEIGDHVIRIAVGACDPDEENLALTAERYFHPVIAYSCGRAPDPKKAEKSLFHVEGAVLSAIKQAEDENGFIVRVYNPAREERQVRLSMPGRKAKVSLANFLEEDEETIAPGEDGSFACTLGKGQTASFRMTAILKNSYRSPDEKK